MTKTNGCVQLLEIAHPRRVAAAKPRHWRIAALTMSEA
jgi:hypothetical protein